MVNVARTDFSGSIDLAAAGLPTGVTAAFSPSALPDGTASSTLTLTATSVATPGNATITVTASGTGLDSRTATFTLTVDVAGTYSLAASPASVTLNQGANATTVINVTRTGGFAQAVSFATSGLPVGVTAGLSPAAQDGAASTLTFTAAGNATVGTATVTITGTTPGLGNQTTTVSLIVQQPPSVSVVPSAGSLSLAQGASGTGTLNATTTVALTVLAAGGTTNSRRPRPHGTRRSAREGRRTRAA